MFYTYNYSFIIKDTNQNQPNEETHKVRSGRVPKAELLCPFSIETRCVILAGQCVRQPRNFHQASVSRAFIGVLLHRHNWLNYWSHDWTQYPAPPLPSPEEGRLGWNVSQIPSPLIAWLIFLTWPVPILGPLISISYLAVLQGSPH